MLRLFKRRSRTGQLAEKEPITPVSAPAVSKFTTELRETGYITEWDLKAKLMEVFGPGDYKIKVGFPFLGGEEIYEQRSFAVDKARTVDLLCATKVVSRRTQVSLDWVLQPDAAVALAAVVNRY